jgi:hypothetical protein
MFCACSDMKQAPKGIDADGTTYIACRGFVTVSGNLQEGYQVRFTDESGLDHDVRGIHKLEILDLPDKTVCGQTKTEAGETGARETNGEVQPQPKGVNEACKKARANGTNEVWNEAQKKYEINPVCEQ